MKHRILAGLLALALVPSVAGSVAAQGTTMPQTGAPTGSPMAPATAAPAGGAVKRDKMSMQFVTKTAVGNLFEIQSSRVALEKAQNEAVKSFAQTMIQDHTAATERMKALGGRMPTKLDARHAGMVKTLRSTPAARFDQAYLQAQVKAHEETVALFESYARSGTDPQLKAFATEMLPTLQGHLDMVRKMATS